MLLDRRALLEHLQRKKRVFTGAARALPGDFALGHVVELRRNGAGASLTAGGKSAATDDLGVPVLQLPGEAQIQSLIAVARIPAHCRQWLAQVTGLSQPSVLSPARLQRRRADLPCAPRETTSDGGALTSILPQQSPVCRIRRRGQGMPTRPENGRVRSVVVVSTMSHEVV